VSAHRQAKPATTLMDGEGGRILRRQGGCFSGEGGVNREALELLYAQNISDSSLTTRRRSTGYGSALKLTAVI
jgi:hypothetical protein